MLGLLRGREAARENPTLYWEHIGNCSLRRGELKLVREYLDQTG